MPRLLRLPRRSFLGLLFLFSLSTSALYFIYSAPGIVRPCSLSQGCPHACLWLAAVSCTLVGVEEARLHRGSGGPTCLSLPHACFHFVRENMLELCS
ncbi:beta-1,4-galactosyltransferase 5 [Arapaima gigas]